MTATSAALMSSSVAGMSVSHMGSRVVLRPSAVGRVEMPGNTHLYSETSGEVSRLELKHPEDFHNPFSSHDTFPDDKQTVSPPHPCAFFWFVFLFLPEASSASAVTSGTSPHIRINERIRHLDLEILIVLLLQP